MERARLMGERSIPALLVSFSIPAIIGMVVQAMYNVVDRIFIGRGVGALGIAGATIGFPIMLIIMAFGMLVALGANALISIRLGEKRMGAAEQVLGNAVVLLVLLAVALTAGGLIFLTPLLRLFGASETVLPYAREYMRIILMGTIFQSIGFGMNNFIRGEGNPKIAMLTMIIGAVLNMILDPIFIFVFGMGIKGAAVATVISQGVAATWVLFYFLGGKSQLKIHLHNLRLDNGIVGSIVAIGSPPFAMQLAASGIHAILNNQLLRYGGDLAISAIGIIWSIAFMIIMPIIGLNQGAQPIIGYNYGARMYGRVKRSLQLSILAATVWVILGFIPTQLFPRALIGLFNQENEELLTLGAHAMRTFMIMLPVIGFQIVSSGYFQAVGKPKQAMILTLSRQVLLLIPFLFILPYFFGLNGIWYSGPASDFGSALLTGTWLLVEIRQLNRKYTKNAALNPQFAD